MGTAIIIVVLVIIVIFAVKSGISTAKEKAAAVAAVEQ